MPTFDIQVGLGRVPASVDDVQHEFGDRLDTLRPRLSQQGAELQVSLTVVAVDLWVAVLTTMTALTGTGYPVVQLDARPIGRALEST